jgi:hypothetical protein
VIKFDPRLPALTAARGQMTPRLASQPAAAPMQAQRPSLPGGRPFALGIPGLLASGPDEETGEGEGIVDQAPALRPPATVRR